MLNYQPQNVVNRFQPRDDIGDNSDSDDEIISNDESREASLDVYDGSESDISNHTSVSTRDQRYLQPSSEQSYNFNNSNNSRNMYLSDDNFVNNYRLNNFEGYPPTNNQYRQNNNNDSLSRIAAVFEETLKSVKESSGNVNNLNLMNRLISNKPLPTFSGEPLDWLMFKRSCELYAQSDVDDRVNINRLSEALKGEAYEAVKHLFISGTDSKKIIETLEMRYGNKQLILNKILDDIKILPNIISQNSIVEFASKLKNSVEAIKSLGSQGYLFSPELTSSMLKKLPEHMIFNYIKFASLQNQNKPDLEKLSEFLYTEADMILNSGISGMLNMPFLSTSKNLTDTKNIVVKSNKKAVFTTTDKNNTPPLNNENKTIVEKSRCSFCGRKNHKNEFCHDFAKQNSQQRWKLVRSLRLCFNCLEPGHPREDCDNKKKCGQCNRGHHILLHFTKKNDSKKSNSLNSNETESVNKTVNSLSSQNTDL